MAEQTIHIETALMPMFYKDFHCIMGACQDDCCDDGWRIEFNKKDYLAIKRAAEKAGLEEEVSQGVRRLREREHDGYYAEFVVNAKGRCAFHTSEGLCRLQLQCGPEVLPKVCQKFPRRKEYSPMGFEFSLSPACEGVLALLWDLPQGIDFLEEPLPRKDWRNSIPSSPAAARFAEIRSLCIDTLQERALRLPQRMLLMGVMLQGLRAADWEAEGALDRWLEHSAAMLADPSAASAALDRLTGQPEMCLCENLRVLLGISSGSRRELVSELCAAINADWKEERIDHFTINLGHYRELEAKLEELLGHSEYFFENLMVSIMFYEGFPRVDLPDNMWESYVGLCSLYSFYRFAAICGCDKEVSRERLFHVIVQASRALLHNRAGQAEIRKELFQNDSATLAHMAILLNG